MGVSEFLTTLMNAYPSFEPKDPAGMIRLWSDELGGYTDGELMQAARALIAKGSPFFPALAQVKACLPAQSVGGEDRIARWHTAMDLLIKAKNDKFLDSYPEIFSQAHPAACRCRICAGDDPEVIWAEAQRVSAEWMR